MSEDHYQMPKSMRANFIDSYILRKLPEEKRNENHEKITEIARIYAGRDIDALNLLSDAADKGRLCEFVEKLNKNAEIIQQATKGRNICGINHIIDVDEFFDDCYRQLNN